jgi:FimV-like protein
MAQLTQASGPDWQAAELVMMSAGKHETAIRKTLGSATTAATIADLIKTTGISGVTLPRINLSDPTMIGDIPSMNQKTLIAADGSPKVRAPAEFDLPINLATTAMKEPENEIQVTSDDIEFDIQMSVAFDAPIAAVAVKNESLKLNPISFGVPLERPIAAPAAPTAPAISPNSIIEFNVSKFDLNPESTFNKSKAGAPNNDLQAIETKFSLAQAYMDIGDKDGAKELLQEVLESGHQSLTGQAKALLLKL